MTVNRSGHNPPNAFNSARNQPKASTMGITFPFSAIVGQEDLKTALMVLAVEPRIGGVLILGDRGTGKSTAVRALATALPSMAVVTGCAYNCDPAADASACASACALACDKRKAGQSQRQVPVVDLPLGVTEDRVVGALDLERALTRGEKVYEPGLLARAHRGFLYIDEVNLLEDHIVDLLLDAAASGESVVEREGLSVRHPARFVLVGSGNPEEGDLRPQMLDRFGLAVDIKTPTDIQARVEIMRRRDAFDREPAAFVARFADAEAKLRETLVAARQRLNGVAVSDKMMETTAALCARLGTDGLRGELTLMRAARALASLQREPAVTPAHIRKLAASALGHRLRRDPLDEAGSAARVGRAVDEAVPA
jgi:magnesium chelatase subunit I